MVVYDYKFLDPKTVQMKPTGKVFNHAGEEVEPAYWLGKYSDMPHIFHQETTTDGSAVAILVIDQMQITVNIAKIRTFVIKMQQT